MSAFHFGELPWFFRGIHKMELETATTYDQILLATDDALRIGGGGFHMLSAPLTSGGRLRADSTCDSGRNFWDYNSTALYLEHVLGKKVFNPNVIQKYIAAAIAAERSRGSESMQYPKRMLDIVYRGLYLSEQVTHIWKGEGWTTSTGCNLEHSYILERKELEAIECCDAGKSFPRLGVTELPQGTRQKALQYANDIAHRYSGGVSMNRGHLIGLGANGVNGHHQSACVNL